MDETCDNPSYPLSTAMIVSWLESLRRQAAQAGVELADLRKSQVHIPAVAADFDANQTIGRISAWISGEFDFEVLRRKDGEFAFFRQESVTDLTVPKLQEAVKAFLKSMANPDE